MELSISNDTEEVGIAISAGGSHSLVLTNKGNVYGCGRLDNGRLGFLDRSSSENESKPNKKDRIGKLTKIALEMHLAQSRNITPYTSPMVSSDTRKSYQTPPPHGSSMKGRSVDCISCGGAHSLILVNTSNTSDQEEEEVMTVVDVDTLPIHLIPGIASMSKRSPGMNSPVTCAPIERQRSEHLTGIIPAPLNIKL